MAVEIERKFLVNNKDYRRMSTGSTRIVQGYLSTELRATIRVRLRGEKAYFTVKGANIGSVRDEWEYEIPVDDAIKMLERCATGAVIDKERFIVPYEGHVWEVDEFQGHYEGLIIAEVELSDENEPVSLPPFVGQEVTGNTHYYNSVMASTDHLRVVDGRLV
jgi:adenylate cyclase